MSTTAATHPEVSASFRADGHGGFISRNGGFLISCPPYTIASSAATDPGLLTLPEGYDEDVLEHVKAITGWTERDVYIWGGRRLNSTRSAGRSSHLPPQARPTLATSPSSR